MLDVLPLVRDGLGVVGILAIGTWMLRWVSAFTNKQKELSAVDKEIRETLQHHVSVHRDHAKMLEENFARETGIFRKRLGELDQELSTTKRVLTQQERHLLIIEWTSRAAVESMKMMSQELRSGGYGTVSRDDGPATNVLRHAELVAHAVPFMILALREKPDASISDILECVFRLLTSQKMAPVGSDLLQGLRQPPTE